MWSPATCLSVLYLFLHANALQLTFAVNPVNKGDDIVLQWVRQRNDPMTFTLELIPGDSDSPTPRSEGVINSQNVTANDPSGRVSFPTTSLEPGYYLAQAQDASRPIDMSPLTRTDAILYLLPPDPDKSSDGLPTQTLSSPTLSASSTTCSSCPSESSSQQSAVSSPVTPDEDSHPTTGAKGPPAELILAVTLAPIFCVMLPAGIIALILRARRHNRELRQGIISSEIPLVRANEEPKPDDDMSPDAKRRRSSQTYVEPEQDPLLSWKYGGHLPYARSNVEMDYISKGNNV